MGGETEVGVKLRDIRTFLLFVQDGLETFPAGSHVTTSPRYKTWSRGWHAQYISPHSS